MKGLLIPDKLRWNDEWSSQIGRQLEVHDSSDDLFIFESRYRQEDILKVLGDVPPSLYRLFDVEEAPREECDFLADSGTCYRRLE